MSNSTQRHLLLGAALLLAACDYSAPDYSACDPDRPSEQVSLAQFDGTLQGTDAPVADVIAAIGGDHEARARASDGDAADDSISLGFGFEIQNEATLIPASEGCEIDRLELTATTRVRVPDGAEAEGTWSFSLSKDTAQETFGAFEPEQAALVFEALGLSVEDGAQLDMGFGARFVSADDLAQAAFSGSGTVATRGGPSTPSIELAQFEWGG